MMTFQKLPRRLIELGRYLSAPSDSTCYIGWLGHQNLGDEALFQAIENYFSPLSFSHCHYGKWLKRIERAIGPRRHGTAFLGGGTLIGTQFLDEFRQRLRNSKQGIAFGTGVEDKTFRSSTNSSAFVPLADWKPLLQKCIYTGVRGPYSLAALRAEGIQAEVIGDPACFFVQEADFWQPVPRRLGVNIGIASAMWTDDGNFLPQLTTFLDSKRRQGWEIEFFVVWPPDIHVTRQVAREAGLSNPVIHCCYEDPLLYMNHAKFMSAFIGLKLHAVILAMCAHVPSIMLEYQPKCRDFMASIGQETHTLRIDQITPPRLNDLFDELMLHGPSLSQEIALALRRLKNLQMDKARQLKLILNK